jgi:NAD-dependent dihydropyrimidine dehydrogenase PreA subunit
LIFSPKPIMLTPMRPAISQDLCENCGECIDICPYDVFGDLEGFVSVINPEECIECTACIDTCPQKAISMDN